MISIFKIFVFIYKNNSFYKIPYFCIKAFVYQIFKRLHKGIISHKIFNNKKIFLFPNCNISTMFIYTPLPQKVVTLFVVK